MIQKSSQFRSSKYLRWVKTLPCAICGAPADDAHHGIGLKLSGMGMTAPDHMAMPVCRGHHAEIHNTPEMWVDQWRHIANTLGCAIDEGVICIK